jgi:hypothetical protein
MSDALLQWLHSINVKCSDEVLGNLADEGVEVESFSGLSEANLKELGFKMSDRGKILGAVKKLGE